MSAFPLVAAHLLDCNRFTWDPRAEDVAVLKAATPRKVAPLPVGHRPASALARRPREVANTGRRHRRAVEWTRA